MFLIEMALIFEFTFRAKRRGNLSKAWRFAKNKPIRRKALPCPH